MTALKVHTTGAGVDSYADADYDINRANAVLTVTDHQAHQTISYGPSGWSRIERPEVEMPATEREDF